MMSKRLLGAVIAMASIFGTCGGGSSGQEVRRCVGAGQWFPAEPGQLRKDVERYLAAAKIEAAKGEIVALVAPHAGYMWSGPVAGYSYATVRGKSYKRVIVLGLSHRYPLTGASVLDVDAYETPLGQIPVDRECVKALLATKAIQTVAGAHRIEWSDENQLPFLQVALKPGWKLVSVLVGEANEASLEAIANALRPHIFGETLVVVGTDFTHLDNTTAAVQNKADLEAANLLVAKDYQGFVKIWTGPQETICGRKPLAVLLKLLDKDCTGHLLQHRISGEMPGGSFDYSVGYCAIAYTTPTKKPSPASKEGASNPGAANSPGAAGLQSDRVLTAEEEQTLLRLARATLVEWVERGSKQVDLAKFDLTPTLQRKLGAFVTLHEHGDLRGCIGYIEPIKPLCETVMDNARNAATEDTRFPPVTKKELGAIDLEISVLSPMRKIASVDEIVIGRHGLMIRKGPFNQGVFLPQVPVEQGWNLEQYLEGICRKAGLPRGAWREGADLFVFTAQVFGEKESRAGGKAK